MLHLKNDIEKVENIYLIGIVNRPAPKDSARATAFDLVVSVVPRPGIVTQTRSFLGWPIISNDTAATRAALLC